MQPTGILFRFFGIACPWSCGAPLETTSQEEMLLQKITTACAPILRKPQLDKSDYAQIKGQFRTLHYFPQEAAPRDQLLYLANLSSEQSPYSQITAMRLKRAYDATRHAKTWLRIALITTIVFPILGLVISKTTKNDQALFILMLLTIMGGLASTFGTGTNPDLKSDELNYRQDCLNELREVAFGMATALIEENKKNSPLARFIAGQLNLQQILSAMLRDDPLACGKNSAVGSIHSSVIKKLEMAIAYVLSQPLPAVMSSNVDIYNFIATNHLLFPLAYKPTASSVIIEMNYPEGREHISALEASA